jgi:type IV pilus assembly protein PilW
MKRERGWTIVEFSIASLLGLLLMLLASGLLLAASGNYRHHSETALLDDGGRYAMQAISLALRQAGHVNWDSASAPVDADPGDQPYIMGWDARSLSKAADGIDHPLPDVANGSDVLAVRYAGSGSGSDGDGSTLNCAGFGVAAPASAGERGWSIFYVALDSQGVAELRCKYRGDSGWGADAVVRGVDSFQVLYGVDTDAVADGVPNTYLSASAVRALDAAIVPSGATAVEQQRDRNRRSWWRRVASVRVALLLHGEAASHPGSAPAQYDLFGKAYSDAHAGDDAGARVAENLLPDAMRHRTRRVVSTTVALRNHGG